MLNETLGKVVASLFAIGFILYIVIGTLFRYFKYRKKRKNFLKFNYKINEKIVKK